MDPTQTNTNPNDIEIQFIENARSQFAALQSEVAQRNAIIAENDQYVYGDKLERMLDIPVGHDMTPVNWLRRTVEIHRSQFMGKGFAVDSSYQALDISASGADDPNEVNIPALAQNAQAEKQRLTLENEKKKGYAEMRRKLIEAIIRDNGGSALFAAAAENASAVGDSIIKGWYNEDDKKYELQMIEIVENFYALWSRSDYRRHDAVAYIWQISKEDAVAQYGVAPNVSTSPLGTPIAALVQAQVAQQYITTQPMVTILEITGKLEGWGTDGNGHVQRCSIGDENELNVIIVGDVIYQIIDDPKKIPHYYILPNKRIRRRPWGMPDITHAAIMINLTYIEALSDWRTLASKTNFPKFKGFGFPFGVQPPKPKPRTIEILPLSDGQDIQPISDGTSGQVGERDFMNQLVEMENQFVREVGISRQLFDAPDSLGNSNPALLTSMKSISDITDAKRNLWEPILKKIFDDALQTLAYYDDSIKEIVNDDDWFVKISWPSALNADDSNYHAMLLNQFNTGLLSIQSLLEKLGYDKQEVDRIREEMEDPVTASIHGHILSQMAEYKLIPFGTPMPPKVSVTMRGDLTPEQEGNLAASRGFNDGPYGTSAGPQGNGGLSDQDNSANAGFTSGGKPGATAVNKTPSGGIASPLMQTQPGTQPGAQQPAPSASGPGQGQGGEGGGFAAGASGSPELINTGTATGKGRGIMSQPGSGAPMTSAKGKMAQHNQRRGK